MKLNELLNLGIVVSIDDKDGGLLLDAPKGAIGDDLIEQIRQAKSTLLAELQTERELVNLVNLGSLCLNVAGNCIELHHWWRVHYRNGTSAEVWTDPPASIAEILGRRSDAAGAEPFNQADLDALLKMKSQPAKSGGMQT